VSVEDARQLEAAGFLPGAEQLYRQAGTADGLVRAESAYRQALIAIESQLGSGHPEAATVYRLLAENADADGRDADAEAHARTALVLRETALGADNTSVAADRALLAALLAKQAAYDEAEELLRQALATFDGTTGTESYQAARAAHQLATVLFAEHRFDEAAALYRRSLSAKRRLLGDAHADVAVTLHDWAILCEQAGLDEQARLLWAKAEAVTAAVESGEPNCSRSGEGKCRGSCLAWFLVVGFALMFAGRITQGQRRDSRPRAHPLSQCGPCVARGGSQTAYRATC
jgi:tetratricopeptide (TPR) repeat protein